MKPNKLLLVFILLMAATFISSCAGARGAATSWPGITANEDKVYVAYDQHVYAVNLTNGFEQWRFPIEGDTNRTFYARPTLTSDNQLLVGGYDKSLYSLDPENGVEQWAFTGANDRYIGNPLIMDDKIFAPNADKMLYATDLQGNMQWNFETEGPQWAQPISDPECTCVYLPSMDHSIYSIDAESGRENWRTEELGGSIAGIPAFSSNGALYAGTFANEMLAINTQNGQVLWRTPTNGWVWGGPALKDDRLYFGDLSGAFYALDASSGQIIWQHQFDSGAISDTPLVTEDSIYFTTESGAVYALNLDGNSRWNKPIEGKLYSSPVLAGELILVAAIDADALVYALDSNGNTQWGFTPVEN